MIEKITGNEEEILAIYDACRRNLLAQGIPQWHDGYPVIENVLADIADGTLFGVKNNNGNYIGVITLNEEQHETYATVSWQHNEGTPLVVHRLAVHPDAQGMGIARQLMDFAEELAVKNGYSSIRLDAYSDNPRSLKLYEGRGYIKRGEVCFPRRPKIFYCYEKVF